MDVKFRENDFEFLLRTSALIYNSSMDKILLFKVEGRQFYLLPGGKVERFDESQKSLIREMKEEIGEEFSKIDFNFLALSEEFLKTEDSKFHQINIIYKGIYTNKIITKFKGLEGDWINFEWVDLKDLDNINIHPEEIKNVIKNHSDNKHFITRVG